MATICWPPWDVTFFLERPMLSLGRRGAFSAQPARYNLFSCFANEIIFV